MTAKFKAGDLVWAKLRYCPAWPAKLLLIMAPNSGNIGSLSTYHQLQIAEAKVVFQWCVDQGLIASGYQCPKCKQQLGN
ncbi:hypothetical protein AVEN_63788-1 [Araneus ventricosus]|uniref:PWWP domain-containing protein n=1 Tax=Araneus ventricosus TaxID=182803 RepID=A0A4Y2GWP7_ARAVE|nr:hypothetical protein AVEN_63788-1 [Araneus ventricosus]